MFRYAFSMRDAGDVRLLAQMRSAGSDSLNLEAKRARTQLPKDLDEKICGMSNGTGGYVLLGVDEESGFQVTGVADPKKATANLQQLVSDRIDPPLRVPVYVVAVDGEPVVVAEILGAGPGDKPVLIEPMRASGRKR